MNDTYVYLVLAEDGTNMYTTVYKDKSEAEENFKHIVDKTIKKVFESSPEEYYDKLGNSYDTIIQNGKLSDGNVFITIQEQKVY